jgi:hypothetical protein
LVCPVSVTVPAQLAPLAPLHLSGIDTEPLWTTRKWLFSEALAFFDPGGGFVPGAAVASRCPR